MKPHLVFRQQFFPQQSFFPFYRVILITTVIIALLPIRGLSQAAHETSRIKKPLIYQVGNTVRINAEGPRPLLRALDALQEKYGWIVDYEDPQYPADLDSANSQSLPRRRQPRIGNSRGNFSVEFHSAPNATPDEDSVLKIVVDGYNQSDADGQFELRKEFEQHKEKDARFDVVGTGVRNQGEEILSQQPVLDLLITLKEKRRSADETVALICQEVSQQSKIPVTVSGIADNVRAHDTVVVGGTRVSARTLLSRTMATMGEHLTWRLLYDESGKSYELRLAHSSRE